jgi:hypothetical protein
MHYAYCEYTEYPVARIMKTFLKMFLSEYSKGRISWKSDECKSSNGETLSTGSGQAL